MQLKSRVFRLRAKKNTAEVKKLLTYALNCLSHGDSSESFANIYLNISDMLVDEIQTSQQPADPQEVSLFSYFISGNHFKLSEDKVFRQKDAVALQN